MSKHRKKRHSRRRIKSLTSRQPSRPQPEQERPKSDKILRLLPRFGSPADAVARYMVTVLMENAWNPLYENLQPQSPLEDEPEALDTLVDIVAPALALQAMYVHIAEHAYVYREFGLSMLSFQPLTPEQQSATAIWGEICPKDIVPELQAAVEVTTQARKMLPNLTGNIFWPMIGAFFSAVDAGPDVSPQTWSKVIAHPEHYSLLNVFVIAHYGKTAAIQIGVEGYPTLRNVSGWQYCFYCGRAFQTGEFLFYDERWLCPYWCNGDLRDVWEWEHARQQNPEHPEFPRKWIEYPTWSENPDYLTSYDSDNPT